jgi:hypothetical protein
MRFTEKHSKVGIRRSHGGHFAFDLLHKSEPASGECGVSGKHLRTHPGHFVVV